MIVSYSKHNSDVNILVLAHNSIDITKKFLSLLYKYTDDFVLTFIDNGSTDGTYDFIIELCKNFNNVNFYKSEKNLGVIGGRNKAYDIASSNGDSKYYIILDNDQFVKERWLENHMQYMDSYGYDVLGVEAWQMRNDFYPFKKIHDKNEYFTYVGCGGSLICDHVIKDIGLFDDRFNPSYFEDPDFTFRAVNAGYQVGWNPAAKIIHLPHQTLGNIADKNERFLNSFKKFREKWKGYTPKKLTL